MMKASFKVKGVVRLERKNQYGEVFEVIEKENVFTTFGLKESLNLKDVADTYNRQRALVGGVTGSPVHISTQTTSPTEGNEIVTNLVGEAIWDFGSALPRVTWVDETVSLPMYGEIRVRLDAPGAPRSFQTIAVLDHKLQPALTGNNAWDSFTVDTRVPGDSQTTAYCHSYLLLDSPVVQGALEIIDIFYRLYFIPGNGDGVTTGGSIVRNIGRRLMGLTASDPWQGEDSIPTMVVVDNAEDFIELPYPSSIDSLNVRHGQLASSFQDTDCTYNNTTGEITCNFVTTTDLTYLTGRLLKTLLIEGGEQNQYCLTARNFVDTNRTPIQTSWAKRDGGLPFFDENDFALGVGRINRSATWTGDYPEMYKIIITTSGGIGVAEYRVERMLFSAFKKNSWHMIPALCPQLGHTIKSLQQDKLTYKDSYGTEQRSKIIRHNRRQVVTYNTLGITLIDILDSSIFRILGANTEVTNPLDKLDVTNIAQVYSDETVIYVACRDTGLWEIDTTKDLGVAGYVTHSYTGNAYGVTGTNYLGATEIVVATDQGLTTKSQTYATFSNPASTRITAEGWASIIYIEGNVATGFTDGEIAMMSSSAGGDNMQILWWNRASGIIIDGYQTIAAQPVTGTFDLISSTVSALQCSPVSGWWAFAYRQHDVGISIRYGYGRINYGSSSATPTGYFSSNEYWSYSTDIEHILAFDIDTDEAIVTTFSDTNPGTAYETRTTLIKFDSTSNSTSAMASNIGPRDERTAPCINDASTVIDGLYAPERLLIMDAEEQAWLYLGQIFFPAYQRWVQYGWNGSTWIAGSTTSKVVHAAEEAVLNGVLVGFDDKSAINPFFATDFYTIPVCNGALGDNAKTITTSLSFFGSTYRFQIDFPVGGSQLSVPLVSPYQVVVPGASEGGFQEMDVTSVNSFKIFLDGVEVPFSNVLTDGSAPPAAGIVSVDLPTGTLTFNSGDAAKLITGYYSYTLSI